MAAAGTVGSVTVSLHPLVIMNISEHWTRIRAQEGKPQQGKWLDTNGVRNYYEMGMHIIVLWMIMDLIFWGAFMQSWEHWSASTKEDTLK